MRNTTQTAQSSNETMTIALVDWSHLLEDFLDNIGVSFEAFCDEITGGWMFGYIEALQLAGVRTILFCVSSHVSVPTRFHHRPTSATICVLPAPQLYRIARRRLLNPYADSVAQAVGTVRGIRSYGLAILLRLMPYLSTPLVHLARELRREGCHAILCQDYEHGRFDECVGLGKLLRLPVFATFQGGNIAPRWPLRWLRRLSLRRATGLIIATPSEAERVQADYQISPKQIGAIFNPLDLSVWHNGHHETERVAARAELGIPVAARVAVWHGRVLMHRKGLDILLDAWQRVGHSEGESKRYLLLIGNGHDAETLRRQIVAKNLQLSIKWIDKYVQDKALLRRWLAAADVYVFPSRHEGFPVAPIEAMACGLPIVAAAASGIPEILVGGEAAGGIIVPVGEVESFARALDTLLANEPQSLRLGKFARQQVEERFALSTVGVQLREFLVRRGAALKNIPQQIGRQKA